MSIQKKTEFRVKTEKGNNAFTVTVSDEFGVEIETDNGCRLCEAPDLLRGLAEALEHELGDQA